MVPFLSVSERLAALKVPFLNPVGPGRDRATTSHTVGLADISSGPCKCGVAYSSGARLQSSVALAIALYACVYVA